MKNTLSFIYDSIFCLLTLLKSKNQYLLFSGDSTNKYKLTNTLAIQRVSTDKPKG